MAAFHTIAIPHDDILEGRLTMDVFAADLWEVHEGRGVAEYRDPDLFFQKTYITEGLQNMLDLVERRLRGEGGDPVVQVQTPFGGGKTHALIAMYHKANEWGAKTAVIVGTPLSGKETLWGLLEEQLTGKRKDFKGLVSPGRDEIRALLEAHQPVQILIDELLEYVTKAAGVPVEESTLAGQTLAFMQELTEAAATLERVSLVITLPSSILEHFDERAEQLFQQLQRVAGRIEKIYTPVQEHEISQVVRCRLFTQVAEKPATKVIVAFMAYAQREGLLPVGVEPTDYRKRFEMSYPFQPEVIDILYHRWGSFPTFQRTRGVLRLLALVVHSVKESALQYISLGDFDLAEQEIRRELLKHIGPEFDSVIGSDITGPEAGAHKINAALGKSYQGLRLGERTATTIFMYSFSGGPERGAGLGEIKRSAAYLEAPSAVIAEVAESLKEKYAFYLDEIGGRYFFKNEPNINRLLITKMESISEADLESVEMSLVKERVRGTHLKLFSWPGDPSEIPDTPDMKLLILREGDEELIRRFLEEKGETPRVHRNTMFFLVAMDSDRITFENLARRNLAYYALQRDPTLTLTDEQKGRVKQGIKQTEGDLSDALRRMYRFVFLPAKEGLKQIDLGIPTFGEKRGLDEEVYDRLRSEGEILERFAPAVIKERYLREREWVSTAQLYQASLTTPGEVRLVGTEAWKQSIAEGVRLGVFGLGDVEDNQSTCRYFKQEAPIELSDPEVIIREELCEESNGDGPTPPPVTKPGPEVGSEEVPQRSSLHLRVSIPKGKVASLMGLMNYLQSKFNRMELAIDVDDGSITDQDYEEKVMETFRQMGVEVETEDS